MILLIWVLITLYSSYSCYAATNTVVENVYIDTLVQRYLAEEKLLWNYMYTNYTSDRSTKNLNFILNKIPTIYYDTVQDPYMEHVMSVAYMSKFIKYMDFYNVQTYVEESQHKMLSSLDAQHDSYLTFEMTFSVYNYTRLDQLFYDILEDSKPICNNWSMEMQSISQKLYMFYEILSANLLSSYVKCQRANMQQVVKRGFEEHDSELLRSKFNEMYGVITGAAKDTLRRASRTTWMCDKDATYDMGHSQEITNFLRGYIDNEINLNSEQSCYGTCSDYKFTKNYGCYNETFCDEQRKVGEADPICRGTIVDCLFIEDKLEICPSESGRNRRYEYINYGCTPTDRRKNRRCEEQGRYFGRSKDCKTTQKTVQTFRNEWLMTCNYCFCYCDEQVENSDRYFSLRPVVSDVRENMIVSGVAIIKRNGIFSFSITQSKLISYGQVQQHNSDQRGNIIYSNFRRNDVDVIDGIDYHTLSWQNRSINLDTIILPRGCVVTGVRFVVNREHIGLEIRSTKFDFNSGTLLDANEWIGADNWDRTNYHIDRPEPNRYFDENGVYLSVPDFRPNFFVKFRPSDPDKDAGQTTVPFIDTQWVRPKNLTPLSGIGIYYKGKPGLGGFIAPAVVTYDMWPHIGNKLSEENVKNLIETADVSQQNY